MIREELNKLLETAQASRVEDWEQLPEGRVLTLHVASNGVGLSVGRIEAIQVEGDLVTARTTKSELFLVNLQDVFAGMIDSSSQKGRKAGFV